MTLQDDNPSGTRRHECRLQERAFQQTAAQEFAANKVETNICRNRLPRMTLIFALKTMHIQVLTEIIYTHQDSPPLTLDWSWIKTWRFPACEMKEMRRDESWWTFKDISLLISCPLSFVRGFVPLWAYVHDVLSLLFFFYKARNRNVEKELKVSRAVIASWFNFVRSCTNHLLVWVVAMPLGGGSCLWYHVVDVCNFFLMRWCSLLQIHQDEDESCRDEWTDTD